jgi:hypothetical protein
MFQQWMYWDWPNRWAQQTTPKCWQPIQVVISHKNWIITAYLLCRSHHINVVFNIIIIN